MNTRVNQVNKQSKGRNMDATWKVYFKHDGCSMLVFKDLPESAAYARIRNLRRLYSDWKGKFILTK